MLSKVVLTIASVALLAGTAGAVELTGILHNNRDEGRATLETGDGIYLLDLGSSYLLDVGERYDRERVRVRGDVSYPRYASTPVIRVDSITFRPYSGASSTYSVSNDRYRYAPPIYRRYETRYERPRYRQFYTEYRRY